jgi:NAD(P)-dependent dehydrogenase (short-subunit alcohol dehydrogenase family)
VLVNNAGIVGEFPPGTPFEQRLKFNAPSLSPLSYIRSVYETNVFGVIAVTQAMLPLLRQALAGRIVKCGQLVGLAHFERESRISIPEYLWCRLRSVKGRTQCNHACVCDRVGKNEHQGQHGLPRLRRYRPEMIRADYVLA